MIRKEQATKAFKKVHETKEPLEQDPELKEIMKQHIYGDVYQHGNMNMSLRELILIVVNTTNHTLPSLKDHVVAGLGCELPPVVIKEAVYQCAPYIGIGKVEEALLVINEVFVEHHIDLPLLVQGTVNENNRFAKGFVKQGAAFGEQNIQHNHDTAPEDLQHIQQYLTAHCFGDFYTREGIDLPLRELITFIILSTLGGCENQLRSHIGANITVGNTRELLIETITQCQPYIGFPRTLNSIALINEVVPI